MGVALKTAPRSTAISPAKCAGGCRLRSLTRNACDTGRVGMGLVSAVIELLNIDCMEFMRGLPAVPRKHSPTAGFSVYP